MNATPFDRRVEKGSAFELDLDAFLKTCPAIRAIAKNGTEHTHAPFVALMRNNQSPGAKFLRFAPDAVMLMTDGRAIHYDAKASINVEKDAYLTYRDYESIHGLRVLLFVRYQSQIFWRDVAMLKFTPSEDVVARHPRQHPIIDGWITPRHGNNGPNGSGTPYKEIDMRSMRKFDAQTFTADSDPLGNPN